MRVGQRKHQAAIRHDRELARSLEAQLAQLLARVAINGGVAEGLDVAKPTFLPLDELRQAWAAWCQQR
jgi:hypothetical protein